MREKMGEFVGEKTRTGSDASKAQPQRQEKVECVGPQRHHLLPNAVSGGTPPRKRAHIDIA
jgi:hypothetical protein